MTTFFVFYFTNAMDRKRVLEGGPWNFDNALLVLEIPTGFGDLTDMEFRWTPIWIQIHNIPLICMTKQIGFQLGQHIGTVKEIDVGSSGDYFGKFLRIRVCVDIQKPLHKALRVKLDGVNKEKTLLLKYERLPEHCYLCGMLGHSFRECSQCDESNFNGDVSTLPYGVWMRATSPSKSRPSWSNRRTQSPPKQNSPQHA
ncbi:hypothetical protein ACOSQ2_021839 [Xanthoceras sorbifolium]